MNISGWYSAGKYSLHGLMMNQLFTIKNMVVAAIVLVVTTFAAAEHSQVLSLRQRLDNLEKHGAWFEKETRAQIGMLAAEPVAAPAVAPEAAENIAKLADAQAQSNIERDALLRKLQQTQLRQQQLRAELTRVSAAATNANAQIVAVTSEVGTVKSELASRDSKMDRSLADLKRVMGDLGVQSQLIATNRKELEALRSVGDRNYFDFDIPRAGMAKRISDISLTVRKTDPKRNRFTIEVLSNDKRVEKKDRALNEPIQFYVSRPRPPYDKVETEMYEIVVNEVKKDHIIGYLSTPRAPGVTTAASLR
jgi:hypothetical protein